MTEVSLSTAIFGERKGTQGDILSDLFASSSSVVLPAVPNNVNFSEPPVKEKKIKNKGREKDRDDGGSGNDSTQLKIGDVSSSSKKKKRKTKQTKSEEEGGDQTKDSQVEAEGEANDKDIEEDGIINSDDEQLTIFVGNLPFDITRKQLEGIFKKCGKIKSSRLRSIGTSGVKVAPEHAGNQNLVKKVSVNTKQYLQDTPKKTSQGYVVFQHIDSVDIALKMNNEPVPGNEELILRVDRAKPTMDSTRSVFVGNLPYKANEMTLRSHFYEGCGWNSNDDIVEGVRIVRDKDTMECKGFGYVLLKDKSYVPAALGMHESKYMKRELRVMVCGKRFKNRKGAPKESTEMQGARRRVANKDTKKTLESATDIIAGTKDKKKRGTKKIGVHKAAVGGISKRAASGKKLDKRVKKIQKRIKTGMGKSKK